MTLVDAPGYGGRGREEWGELFDAYVSNRPNLKRIFILLNLDDGINRFDEAMLKQLEDQCLNHPRNLKFQPIFTKVDKLNHGNARGVRQIQQTRNHLYALAPSAAQPWIMTSTKGKGVLMGINEVREAVLLGSGISILRPPARLGRQPKSPPPYAGKAVGSDIGKTPVLVKRSPPHLPIPPWPASPIS